MRILLAEDESHLARGIVYNLEKRGYEVVHVMRGDDALHAACSEAFDAIVLDVMMPGLDGFAVCETIRERRILTPILMLTARHETSNRIKGLKLGADDYLGKPFDLEELLARIAALLRRKQWASEEPEEPKIYSISGVLLDVEQLTLGSLPKQVALTAIECKLMKLLVTERGKPVARTRMLKEVWGLHEETQTRTLDTFVLRLRNRLEDVGGSAEWIESVRGVGYRLVHGQEI